MKNISVGIFAFVVGSVVYANPKKIDLALKLNSKAQPPAKTKWKGDVDMSQFSDLKSDENTNVKVKVDSACKHSQSGFESKPGDALYSHCMQSNRDNQILDAKKHQ